MEQVFIEYGLLGAIILGMGYVIKRLYGDLQTLNGRFIEIVTVMNEQQQKTQSMVERVLTILSIEEYLEKRLEDERKD